MVPIPTNGGRVDGGLAQRASGLYVPAATIQKTLPEQDFRRMKRLMGLSRSHGMEARYFCRECRQPVALDQEDRLIQGSDRRAPGGRFVLECGCTTWRVR